MFKKVLIITRCIILSLGADDIDLEEPNNQLSVLSESWDKFLIEYDVSVFVGIRSFEC